MNARSLLLSTIAALVPLVLSAQTVYESTNEQGVTEFSDQPSSGASAVTVKPNVVETTPTPEIETYKRPEKKQAAAKSEPAPSTETEYTVIHNNNRRRHNDLAAPGLPGPPVPTTLPAPGPGPAVGRN